MEVQQYELMLKKLSELTVLEVEKDMIEKERLVRDMVIVESGETTVKMAIIDKEDVEMVSIARNNLSTGHIKWADEQMDIVITEDTKQEGSLWRWTSCTGQG